MKDLLVWWFFPERAKRVSSIIKIFIGLFICYSFFDALIRNTIDLIDAFVNPPIYLGMSFLLLPIISSLFTMAIFWSGLFYLPYCTFGKRSEGMKRYLIPVLLVALIIGSGAGAVYTKPGTVEVTQTQLGLLEVRLGEMNKIGEFYTLREFSYDIAELTDPLPELFINEAEGFSKLVLFYKDCEKEWEELYILPTSSPKFREEWRASHIEEEAMLLFWGKYTESVFRLGTPEWEEVSTLLSTWFSYFEINKRMHPVFADWTLLPK